MIKLPYGLADFRGLRQEGMVYVDRTAHIRDVEQLGSVLVFLRPRLLIDEYDNFINEVMASDVETYRSLVDTDGPFKLLFKAVKALFLAVLLDDSRYVTFSGLELAKSYADLFLLVRPEMRQHGYLDLLFEFKLVRRQELGKKAKDLAKMSEETLRQLPPVAAALAEAREQALGYRKALIQRLGRRRCVCAAMSSS